MRHIPALLAVLLGLADCAVDPWFAQNEPNRVLVAGATGRAGTAIRLELRKQGFDVRSLARSPEQAIERFGAEWDWVEGDVRDPASLRMAMRDVDYVISVIGSREAGGPNGPEFVDYGGVHNLVEAAKAEGVRRFVLISSAAAGKHRKKSTMKQVGQVRYWKTMGENALKRSDLDYTIIGPGGLVDEPETRKGLHILPRSSYDTGEVAIGDLAVVAVSALSLESAKNKTFALIWDNAVDRVDWLEQLDDLPADTLTDESDLEPEPNSTNR